MKHAMILAAMLAVAACHSRNEDQVGAAPDAGATDTAGVTHVIDTARTGPPGMQGRPGDATITLDSVGVDSAAVGRDTTGGWNAPTSTPQDTLGPRTPDTTNQSTTDTTRSQQY